MMNVEPLFQATSLCSPHAPKSRFLTSSVAESSQVGSLGVGGAALGVASRQHLKNFLGPVLMVVLIPHITCNLLIPGDIAVFASCTQIQTLNLSFTKLTGTSGWWRGLP